MLSGAEILTSLKERHCCSGHPCCMTSSEANARPESALQTVQACIAVALHLEVQGSLVCCSDLVIKVQEHLAQAGFSQHPCLGCSKQNAKLAFAV